MMTFDVSTPESIGLTSRNILDFVKDLEEKHIPMHSFLLFSGESIVAEGYYAPYEKDSLHRAFSISKSFTAIASGILEAEGRLALSDPIIKYFPDMVPKDVHPWIAEMTIEQMLMMRTCHASTTYKGAPSDWVRTFFTTPPTHKPGTVFHYDTSSAHVLAALAERLASKPMLEFLKERLSELDLSKKSYMIADPDGVSMGGSGLVATTEDLLKFGYLLLHKGNVNGKQLVPASFIERATSCLTQSIVTGPLPSESCGYGYMIWQAERNGYVCYGMGGQFIMVFPEKSLIFITTADTQGIAGGNQLIYDSFYNRIYSHIGEHFSTQESDRENSGRRLTEKLASLAIAPLSPYAKGQSWSDGSPHMASCNAQVFSVKGDNVSGFNYFSFIFENPGKGILRFGLNHKNYELYFGFGKMETGIFPIYNLAYAASGAWIDENTLYIRFHIIDKYVGSVHMQFYFGGNDITVYMKKIEESCFEEFSGHFYGTKE